MRQKQKPRETQKKKILKFKMLHTKSFFLNRDKTQKMSFGKYLPAMQVSDKRLTSEYINNSHRRTITKQKNEQGIKGNS